MLAAFGGGERILGERGLPKDRTGVGEDSFVCGCGSDCGGGVRRNVFVGPNTFIDDDDNAWLFSFRGRLGLCVPPSLSFEIFPCFLLNGVFAVGLSFTCIVFPSAVAPSFFGVAIAPGVLTGEAPLCCWRDSRSNTKPAPAKGRRRRGLPKGLEVSTEDLWGLGVGVAEVDIIMTSP